MSLSRKSIAFAWGAPVLVSALLLACTTGPSPSPPVGAGPAPAQATAAANSNNVIATRTAIADNAIAARGATSTVLAAAGAATTTSVAVTRTAQAESAAATQTASAAVQQAAASATRAVVATANANALATRTSVALSATQTAMPTPTPVLPAAVAVASPSTATPQGSVLLTNFRAPLLLLNRYPELLPEKPLLDAVTQQVRVEQTAWKTVDCYPRISFQDSECHNLQHPQPGGLNPRRSTFFFEWQKVLDSQPDLARGALLKVFSDPAADWSFFKREQDWDDSFDNLVQVFVFSRESIQGREPAFVARDLMPVYRDLLKAAAASQPSHYWFKVDLPRTQYDFSSSTYKFSNNPASADFDLLSPPNTQAGFPEETKGRANYAYNSYPSEQEMVGPYGNAIGGTNGLRLRVPIQQMASAWRQGVATLLIGTTYPTSISLDHQLRLPPIQVQPALAEKMSTRNPQFQARVYINVDHAWSSSQSAASANKQTVSGLFAQIERVDIYALMQPTATSVASGSGSLDEQLLATFS